MSYGKENKTIYIYIYKITLKRGFPGSSDGKESACNVGLENSMDCVVYGVPKGPDTTERLSLHRNVFIQGFLNGSAGKESACNAEDLAAIPGLGRSSGEGNGYPLQYSGLRNSTDCIVHGVSKSRT